MVGWHHRLNGHEFERNLGDSEGWGSLACCSPWDSKVDTTEQLNNNKSPPKEREPEADSEFHRMPLSPFCFPLCTVTWFEGPWMSLHP